MKADFSFGRFGSDIHLWSFPTRASEDVRAKFEGVLAPDEAHRANRFRFPHLRETFVLARGALRFLLGRYLNVHPASIRFVYGSSGKPALALTTSLEFNLTHSGDLAAVALCMGCELGVDVERLCPLPDMHRIARQFFCPEETSEIMSLPEAARERAFFDCWTRKEAYIKAVGDGFSTPLDGFRVTVQPGISASIVHVAHDSAAAKAWTLHDLCLAQDYAAALAYCDQPRSLCWRAIDDLCELDGLS